MTDQPKPSRFPALFKNQEIEGMNALYLYRWVADTVFVYANAGKDKGFVFDLVENGVRYVDLDEEEGLSEPLDVYRYVIEVPKEWRIEVHVEITPAEVRWPVIRAIEGDQNGVRRYLEWLRSVFGRDE